MAKEPVELHRFRIICEADSEHMGPILAQLTLMGVENIGYELITDVKAFGRGKRNEVTAVDLTKMFLANHPTFHVRQLGSFFAENGRNKGTAHYAVRVLAEKNILRDLGDGNYQSAEIALIEGPKSAALPAPTPAARRSHHGSKDKNAKKAKRGRPPKAEKLKRPPNPISHYDIPNRTLIDRKMKGRKRITLQELRDHFDDEGRNSHSVSPILTKMIAAKEIKVIGQGVYEILPKNEKKKPQTGTDTTTPTPGVAAAPEMTETAHG